MGRGPELRRAAEARTDDAEPWLNETNYEDEGPIHTLIGTRLFVALIGIVVLLTIGIVVGVSLVSKRVESRIDIPPPGVEAPLLTSPGAWKVAPTGPDSEGVPVDGQGQTLYGTSEGRSADAQINLDAVPEEPLPRPGTETSAGGTEVRREATPAPPPAPAATAPAPEPAPRPKPKVIEAPAPAKPAPAPAAAAPSAGGSGTIQLGAFSSEARARTAFTALSGRLPYLAGLDPLILPVAQDGKTLYRLRAHTGSAADARDICARLKVAGEACSVVP